MSTKFEDHLYPRGRSETEPDLIPSVKDSDGQSVLYNSSKRKTTESTVVNLGTSPNSNDGDPLRTSFAKVNNFIEASYWVNESINQKFREIDSELREGVHIYTDSDERVNVSLLDNTKLYLRGNPNQVDVNITRVKSPNNPFDWDSEVSININLSETVDINTLNIGEFFSIFDSDGIERVSYKTVDYPTTHDERPASGVDAEFKIASNVVLGRDSDDVLIVNSRVASNFIPYGDENYSLGDSDNKWKDLYLGGNTIYLGSIQIKNYNNRDLILTDSDGNSLNLTIADGRADVLTIDSDFYVGGNSLLSGKLRVRENVQFDSDLNVAGIVYASGYKLPPGATSIDFNDPVYFDRQVTFDSDVLIRGGLQINGATTSLNTQNLAVGDNLIVLNYGQPSPFNDIGFIFTRYDSDSVSPANYNTSLLWDEIKDQFVFGQTPESGVTPNPNINQQYLRIGNQIEFLDSENNARMIWNKSQAKLSILFEDGTEAFTYHADTGEMSGDGFINGGTF